MAIFKENCHYMENVLLTMCSYVKTNGVESTWKYNKSRSVFHVPAKTHGNSARCLF